MHGTLFLITHEGFSHSKLCFITGRLSSTTYTFTSKIMYMKLQSISHLLSQIAKKSHFHVAKNKERKPPTETANIYHNGRKI